MNIVPAIICTMAAALSQNPQTLPVDKQLDTQASQARFEQTLEERSENGTSFETSDQSRKFTDNMRRTEPPVKSGHASMDAQLAQDQVRTPSRPSTRPAPHGGRTQSVYTNDANDNRTDTNGNAYFNREVTNQNRDNSGISVRNDNRNRNDNDMNRSDNNMNRNDMNRNDNRGISNRDANRNPSRNRFQGMNDQSNLTMQNNSMQNNNLQNNGLQTNLTRSQTQNQSSAATRQQGTQAQIGTFTTQSAADERYNELKARLDAQYARMFELKAELDQVHSEQFSKWEEYNCLRQSYEHHLKRVIADWVVSQTL